MFSGVGHSEYFESEHGEVILGEFATRVAGAGLSEAVRLMKLYLRTILGNFSEAHPGNLDLKQTVGVVHLMPNENGIVKSYKGFEALSSRKDVVDINYKKGVGEMYMKSGAAAACASVFVTGPSLEYISASVKEVIEMVEIEISSELAFRGI